MDDILLMSPGEGWEIDGRKKNGNQTRWSLMSSLFLTKETAQTKSDFFTLNVILSVGCSTLFMVRKFPKQGQVTMNFESGFNNFRNIFLHDIR